MKFGKSNTQEKNLKGSIFEVIEKKDDILMATEKKLFRTTIKEFFGNKPFDVNIMKSKISNKMNSEKKNNSYSDRKNSYKEGKGWGQSDHLFKRNESKNKIAMKYLKDLSGNMTELNKFKIKEPVTHLNRIEIGLSGDNNTNRISNLFKTPINSLNLK